MSARRAEGLLALAREALAAAGEAEAELHVRAIRRGVARFAIDELGQHMGLDEAVVRVRVARGARIGEVATTELDVRALVAAVKEAGEVAALAPEAAGFSGFEDGREPTPVLDRWSERTASLGDDERAALARGIIDRVRQAGLVAAGVLSTEATATCIATTRGCARAFDGTTAEVRVWALEDAAGKGASGHGVHMARDVDALAIDRETEAAVRVARDGRAPGRVESGAWDVVMEAPAVAELLEWLGMIAFAAPAVEDGTSPLAGRAGQALTGEHVTITEEPLDPSPLGFAEPFDREGTPRRNVVLVDRGRAGAALADRLHAAHAARAGRADVAHASTGSALPIDFGAEGGVGPVALHLARGAAASVDELVGGLGRGLYIRRLNYVNGYVETRRAVMTGLSRDGCFLVENGKITRAVANVRMTDSFLEMLARADAMTTTRAALASSWTEGGVLVVPAIRFRGVRFTSGSR